MEWHEIELAPQAGMEENVNHVSRLASIGMLVSLNQKREVVHGSAELLEILGRSPGEIYGQQFHDLVDPDWREPVDHLLVQSFNGSISNFTTKIVLPRAAASPLIGLVVATALRSSTPDMSMVVLSIHAVDGVNLCDVNNECSLSAMDAKILEGISIGLTSETLASRLFISRQTVEYRIGRLLRLTGMPNRVSLVAYSYSAGILCEGVWPPRVVNGVIGG
ncbi:LuxR C-terminal-related transcriptional regulator [Streptomyces sp. 8P21H-1]|uniref:helix-turn-helix transcriptional regulator n=1 Tax=Streptomyces sp. 8P21H-1 TaxID=2737048 RepID=UPI00156E5052|nr:LuxR C-terminal-related transcriptional regulator [Streptomyces sp. 8P21H-1]NSL43586.1 hypothetical protein [Streptomyces sp. 8P21H-1]